MGSRFPVPPQPSQPACAMIVEAKAPTDTGDPPAERTLLDAISDCAIFTLDMEGRVTSWNAGATALLGYECPEALGMSVTAFVSSVADTPTNGFAELVGVAHERTTFEGNGCCIHKDGSRMRASIHVYPLAADRFAGLIRRPDRPDPLLVESEWRFRQLVNGVVDYAIFMLDSEGVVSSWNAGAQRIKGYEQDEIVGRHFSCFYTEEDRARGEPERTLAQAREHGRYEDEAWRLRKDGSRFWASIVVDAIRSETGELIGFAKITRDITDRMQMQAELERNRAAMAHSQRMEAIGQLTGGVAHDFNNLLTIIMNNLDVMARAPGSMSRNRHLIENSQQAVEQGARLTSQLLAFARSQPLQQSPQNINALISHFASVLRGAAGSAIDLQLDLDDSLDRISLDATQFKAALLNLVVNAREAMAGEGRLVLTTRLVDIGEDAEVSPRLAPGLYAAITIADNGCGIAADALEHVFEPFYTSKEIGQGSGLGLSQVYGFATQSGGGVGIVTNVGDGTRVTIYLPLTSRERLKPSEAPRQTILLVEDDENVRRSTHEAIELLGYGVIAETNGPDALNRLRDDGDIDILFTDVVMPRGMSGVTLAREARALRPDLRILLASGHPRDAFDLEQDFREFAFLAKPYRLNDLADVLRELGNPPS